MMIHCEGEMNNIRIKVKKQMAHHFIGKIIHLPADKNGVPLDLFWRRRLKDAETDNCCEVIKSAPSKPASTPKSFDRDITGGKN